MAITSISPIDGRYSGKTKELSDYFSEKALISYRIFVEIQYLLLLTKNEDIPVRSLTEAEETLLEELCFVSEEEAEIVKKIETTGYEGIPATNHDVKAVEYFIKLKLADTSLHDVIEMVHFALTSEDINNLAYGLMMRDGLNRVLLPSIAKVYSQLYTLAMEYKDCPMLARTHGQSASPVTFGKEVAVFVNRIKEELRTIKQVDILSKLNGATGNYNAHTSCYPEINWRNFSKTLITTFNTIQKEREIEPYCSSVSVALRWNELTTQIEPHDSFARIFDSLKRINTILIDFSQDMWRYISDGWIKQKAVKGEIGSSAMPHKVNPIDFENAEGNFGVANALFTFFSSKLQVSRLQRDLSDSTTVRNIGTGFAHSLIAYKSLLKGMSKIEVNREKMLLVLQNTPEVIAEAYQNILRKEGVDKPYELLKEVTRGKNIKIDDFHTLVHNLTVDNSIKEKLLAIKPENYIGIAEKIVDDFDPVV